tara:strand:- start:3557 stop:3748 length:192 start_codon:yes stop_codon:yes gene_type:complete
MTIEFKPFEYFSSSQRSLIIHCLEETYWEFSEYERREYREICQQLGVIPYFDHEEGSSTLNKE